MTAWTNPDDGLDGELEKALALSHQVEDIFDAAQQVTLKVHQVSGSLARAGNEVGLSHARNGFQSGDFGQVAGGIMISLGATLIVDAFAKIADGWNRARQERALAEVLARKREIARAKHSVIRSIAPFLERSLLNARRRLTDDAARKIGFDEIERRDAVHEQLKTAFEIYRRLALLASAARFLAAEFEAWTGGLHHSSETVPTPTGAWVSAIEVVRGAAALPASTDDTFSAGTLLLLREPAFVPWLTHDRALHRVVGAFAARWVRGKLLPGGHPFKTYYRACLLSAPLAATSAGRYRHRSLMFTSLTVIAVALGVLFPPALARMRIARALASNDPCASLELTPGEVGHADARELGEINVARDRCIADSSASARAAACRLATEIGAGTLSEASLAIAGDHGALLRRASRGELAASDLTMTFKEFACAGTAGGSDVWTAYINAAADGTAAWSAATSASEDVRAALLRRSPVLEPSAAKALHEGVEQRAQKNLTWKLTPELKEAVAACELESALGFANGSWCKQARFRVASLSRPALKAAAKPAASTVASAVEPPPAPGSSSASPSPASPAAEASAPPESPASPVP